MAHPGTIVGVFLSRVAESGDRTALMERHGDRWLSFGWREWERRARSLAAALIDCGAADQEPIAIFSYSRREWVESDLATLMAGGRTVAIYHNVNHETVAYILGDAKVRFVLAEGPLQVRALIDPETGRLPASIELVVTFCDRQTPPPRPGHANPEEVQLDAVLEAADRGRVVAYEELLRRGEAALVAFPEKLEERIAGLVPSRVAKVIYTSGTTAEPKGVMLTHENLLAVVDRIEEVIDLRPTDLDLLFLPLAHVYAQLNLHAALRIGFPIAFARSMLTAVDDAESVRPTFFTAVPRFFEKIHDAMLAKVAQGGGLRRAVFSWALGVGSRASAVRQRGDKPGLVLGVGERAADLVVFSKLKARLGGRVRFLVSGGAPLARHIGEFFHAAGIIVLEGYGMTENSSLTHANRCERFRFGTVGVAIPGVECRMAEDGEILVRGRGVMKGYLGKPEATGEVLDPDGWLHTGDIGYLDEDGFLTITDRKKELIVTSGGKNIAPAPLEALLSRIPLVSQSLVHGDGRKYLVALVTLDRDRLAAFAREQGLAGLAHDSLCRHPEVQKSIRQELARINTGLPQYETIKNVGVVPRDFAIDTGEMTPTLKLKRRVIERLHRELLDSLYQENFQVDDGRRP